MFSQPKRAAARLTLRERVRDESAHAVLSDVVLAVRAKDGDRAALETLVHRHEPRVRRLASYLLDDPQDAEDAAQEALAKVLTRIDQFRGESRFATWLYSLVANTCRWRRPPRSCRSTARTIWRASVSSERCWLARWAACPPTSGT